MGHFARQTTKQTTKQLKGFKLFKRFVCVTIAIILLLTLSIVPISCKNVSYLDYSTRIFNNAISFDVAMMGKNSDQAYDKMLTTLEELNQQININVENVSPIQNNSPSDILRLNKAKANEQIQIGYHAYYLLNKAKELYATSEGAFNVCAYPLVYLWGVDALSLEYFYSHSDEQNAPVPPSFKNSPIRAKFKPTRQQIQQILPYCNPDLLQVYKIDQQYYAKKQIDQLMVDLGAIAKGYSADICAQICKDYQIESAFINISGNLFMYGNCYDNKWLDNWSIKLKDPKNSGILCEFSVNANSSAVTSGDYQRFRYLVNNQDELQNHPNPSELIKTVCHIINPKTGIPYSLNALDNQGEWDYFNTTNHVISATVIADSSLTADALATAICIMQPNQAKQLIQSTNLKALVFFNNSQYLNVDTQLINTSQFPTLSQYQEV